MENNFANNNFDELFDYVGSVKTIDVPAQQSAKEGKQTEVEVLLAKGTELAAQHETYKQDIVVRGNKALYELLASVYEFANTVENCAQKDKVVKLMRKELKDKFKIKTSTNTPFMTVIVKYIVKSIDRQTAFNYSRVLRVAKEEGVEAKDLASFVANAGGVTKVAKTEAQKTVAQELKNDSKRRITAYRRALVAKAMMSSDEVEYGSLVRVPASTHKAVDDETGAETGEFAIFITYYDAKEDKYRIAGGFDLGKKCEDAIIRHMARRLPTTTEKLESYANNVFAKRSLVDINAKAENNIEELAVAS